MSCFQPYFGGSLPYFSLMSRCGFEEQGGIVDCIQPINISGINDLLVSQAGSAMSRPESLHELDDLLDFPTQVSAADLDSRFKDLCAVLQKARDSFSCRLEEEQDNPFQELRVQLQKAKDRFHSRMAEAANPKMKTAPRNGITINPVQELRDAFRMARKHFLPLLDQYTSTADKPAIAVKISRANAVDCTTILSRIPMGPPNEHNPNKTRRSTETFTRSVTGGLPSYAPSYEVGSNSSPSKASSRLETLIAKELQRREEAVNKVHWNEGFNHDEDRSTTTAGDTIGPTSEVETDMFERRPSTSKKGDSKDGYGGCAPGFFARMTLSAFPSAQDQTSTLESDNFENCAEPASTGHCDTVKDGSPANSNVKGLKSSRLGCAPSYAFMPMSIDRLVVPPSSVKMEENEVLHTAAAKKPGKAVYKI